MFSENFLRDFFGVRRMPDDRAPRDSVSERLDFAIRHITGVTVSDVPTAAEGVSPGEVKAWLRELRELRAECSTLKTK